MFYLSVYVDSWVSRARLKNFNHMLELFFTWTQIESHSRIEEINLQSTIISTETYKSNEPRLHALIIMFFQACFAKQYN